MIMGEGVVMINEKSLKARVVISSDILLDQQTKSNIEKEYGREMTDIEAAECLLYAFLNPKVLTINEEKIIGNWDMVCEFRDKIKNLEVETF
jgi:hypothetical protein